ncbi:MAG: hypothetical protein JWP75_4120 [Frondihabitans sp.]|nr:hypothetical protein [Frondihabitans sp.]
MSDLTGAPDALQLSLLADELGAVAASVPGVTRVQPRPGIARLAKRVIGGIAAAAGSAPRAGRAPRPPRAPDVALNVTRELTLVELDIVIDGDHSGPAVAREVATRIRNRLAIETLPAATVDVRIVAVVG